MALNNSKWSLNAATGSFQTKPPLVFTAMSWDAAVFWSKCETPAVTFALLIRTPTTRVGFIHYFLRTLFFGILAMVKKRSLNYIYRDRDSSYLPQKRPPPFWSKTAHLCLLSAQGHKCFLSRSVFITRRRLLNLHGSLVSYPDAAFTSITWRVKTSCLCGCEDRWEEGMCSHIGSALSPSCLLRTLQTSRFTTGWSIMLASHTWVVFSSQSSGGDLPAGIGKPGKLFALSMKIEFTANKLL